MSRSHAPEQPNVFQWLARNNIIPLLGICFAAIGIYNSVTTKIELQAQHMNYLEAQTQTCFTDIQKLKGDIQSQSLDLKEIQIKTDSKGQVRGISTSSASVEVSPTPKSNK